MHIIVVTVIIGVLTVGHPLLAPLSYIELRASELFSSVCFSDYSWSRFKLYYEYYVFANKSSHSF